MERSGEADAERGVADMQELPVLSEDAFCLNLRRRFERQQVPLLASLTATCAAARMCDKCLRVARDTLISGDEAAYAPSALMELHTQA